MDNQKSNLPSGLYIHIPFCQVKCRYCSFAVFPGLRKHVDLYIKTVEKEMRLYQNRKIDTIYFGGGTPSILSPIHWKIIMENIKSCFILTEGMEITVECNPENINSQLVHSYRNEGAIRLSLGLQTSDDNLLKKIGRTHTWEDFLKAYYICRNAGINNLSVDLIFGLHGQTMKSWKETLEHVLALRPEHLSLYPLEVEKKSAFYFDGIQVDQELQADMYEWSWDRIEAQGYEHYEIFSYSLPEYQCRHNLKYWRNHPSIGIGVSAAGYDKNGRYQNTDRFWNYIETLESGNSPIIDIEKLSLENRLREEMMLGLRLREGIFLTPEIRFRFDLILERLLNQKFLQISQDGKRILCTRKGWLLSNHIYRELLGENWTEAKPLQKGTQVLS